MDSMRRLRWNEGLFLRPHHLQRQDAHAEALDVAYFQTIEPNSWGLVGLEIEESALSNYVLAVKSLRAILPGGALVDVPRNARLPSANIDPRAIEPGRPLHVLLGVRAAEERRAQAAPEGPTGADSRFGVSTEEVYDLDAGRDPVPIEFMHYELRLLLGESEVGGFDHLRLCTLTMTADAARPITLTPFYAPPCLRLSASPFLHNTVRGVVERLATVLREKAEVRSSEAVRDLILYQALAGYLPVLREMVRDGAVHPRRVYQELVRLVGTLYFNDRTGRSFDDIPDYAHDEPGPVFDRLRIMIEALSEFAFIPRYKRVPMERQQGDRFRTRVPAECHDAQNRTYLEVETLEGAATVGGLIEGARISSPDRIAFLDRFMLPGVGTEAQPGPPEGLTDAKSRATYFRLRREVGTEWTDRVAAAGEIEAFVPKGPHDMKLWLVVVMPRQ